MAIDIIIILLFVVYAISAGFRAKKKASRNLSEYFLAGKTVSGWRAGVSMAATQFAADTPLLITGLIATGGIFLLWRLWIYGVAFIMMGFILSSGWRRAGVLTDAELTEVRYSGGGVLPLRILKAFYYGTVINCVVMAMVLVAAMRIAEIFLPWHLWLPDGLYSLFLGITNGLGLSLGESVTGLTADINTTNNMISIIVIISFTTLYSMTGGLRSVVATDVMQFGLAMIGILVYAFVIIKEVGGPGVMTDRVLEIYGNVAGGKLLSFAPTGGEALMPFLVIIGLQWFFQMNSDGTGYLAQRSMACNSAKDARIAGGLFAWLQIFLRSLIWTFIGVGILIIYPFASGDMSGDHFAASREILFVTGINDLLPPGIRGLMLTGLLAALASTIDTHLNWGAGYWSNDIYRRLVCDTWLKRKPRDIELVLAARLSNILILVIALIIMANLGSIQTAWYISLLFGAGMGSVLVLRWLWERINLYSEIAAMAVSLVLAPILLYTSDTEWIKLSLMALISTTAAVAVTFVTPSTDKSTLREFYKRIKPFGFWAKTAADVGDDPKKPAQKLWRGVRAILLTALSLYCIKVGLGKIIFHLPDESYLFPIFSIMFGLLIIPVWWRDLVKGIE